MVDRPSTAAVLVNAAVGLVLWGLIFSICATFVERRFGRHWVWRGWILAVITLTALATIMFHRRFPQSPSVPTTVYMLGMMIAIPSGAVAFAAIRSGRRTPKRSWIRHLAITVLGYFASLPIALIVGVLPDIAALF